MFLGAYRPFHFVTAPDYHNALQSLQTGIDSTIVVGRIYSLEHIRLFFSSDAQ